MNNICVLLIGFSNHWSSNLVSQWKGCMHDQAMIIKYAGQCMYEQTLRNLINIESHLRHFSRCPNEKPNKHTSCLHTHCTTVYI